MANYWYDALGNRVRSLENGQEIYYTYDGLNIIQEDNATTGVKTDYIFAGTTRVAKKTGTEVQYFHGDHLGSTRVITDAAGNKIADFKYAPFGAMISYTGPADTAYKFTGKPEDAGTGLYYFGARYYDPEIGRFITVDPIRSGLNHFSYCANNPLRYIDPFGLYDPDDPDAPANTYNPNSGNGDYTDEEVDITTRSNDDGSTSVTVNWKNSENRVVTTYGVDYYCISITTAASIYTCTYSTNEFFVNGDRQITSTTTEYLFIRDTMAGQDLASAINNKEALRLGILTGGLAELSGNRSHTGTR